MGERKFSKVTKWEIALGAVASLMTGVVVTANASFVNICKHFTDGIHF